MKHRWNGTYSVPIKTNSDPQTVKLENGTNSGNSRKTRHRLAATYLEKKMFYNKVTTKIPKL